MKGLKTYFNQSVSVTQALEEALPNYIERQIERERLEAAANQREQSKREMATELAKSEVILSQKDQEIRKLTFDKRLHSLVIAAERQRSKRLSQSCANANENTAEQLTELRTKHDSQVQVLEAQIAELNERYTKISNVAERRWERIEEYQDYGNRLSGEVRNLEQKLKTQGKKLAMDRTLNFILAGVSSLLIGLVGGNLMNGRLTEPVVSGLKSELAEKQAAISCAQDYIKAVRGSNKSKLETLLAATPDQIKLEEDKDTDKLSADAERHLGNLSNLLGAAPPESNLFGVTYRTSHDRACAMIGADCQNERWYHVNRDSAPYYGLEIGPKQPKMSADSPIIQGRWVAITPAHPLYAKYRDSMEADIVKSQQLKEAKAKQAEVTAQVSLRSDTADAALAAAEVTKLRQQLEQSKLDAEAARTTADSVRIARDKVSNRADAIELELAKQKAELAKALEELKQLKTADKVTNRE